MAVLQRIRSKGVIVMIIVGLALAAFILGDFFSGKYGGRGRDTLIAKINGKKIDYMEYMKHYQFHAEFMSIAQNKNNFTQEEYEALRSQSWNDILQEYLMEPQVEEVGISCSDEELNDMLFGSNIHQIIKENFTNRETHVLDTANIRRFFEEADNDQRYYIIANYWKEVIKKDRINNKFNNLISKGFYTPSAFAEMDYFDKNNAFDFELLALNYKQIPDEDIKLTDADYQTYYDSHKYMFKEKENNRDVEYVVFHVIPSKEDSTYIYEKTNSLREDFIKLENGYEDFAQQNSDVPSDHNFINENELPFGLTETFFKDPIGTTSDVILKDNTYYFSRIIDRSSRPDSVMASHILIAKNDSITIESCRIKADSLKSLIDKGQDFNILALVNSDDPGSKSKGGDLGWFTDGMMVPEFNEACFTNKVGSVVTCETKFGVHIIKIKEQTKYLEKIKLATLTKEIAYSSRTSDYYFTLASSFALDNPDAKHFDEAIQSKQLVKRVASKLKPLDNNISGIENARELVQWAFNEKTKKDAISSVFNFSDKYIVAKLSAIREKGFTPLEDAKLLMENTLIKDKKAEKLIDDLNKDLSSTTDIYALASKYKVNVDTVRNFNFSSFSVQGQGIEPNVNAVVSCSEINKLSSPIKGNNGVFIIKVLSKTDAPQKTDYKAEQLNLMRNTASQVYRAFEAVVDKSKIDDHRAKFF